MSEYARAYIKTCEAFGWSGGPGFNTRIVTKLNGRERRNADWDQPQHSFDLPFQNITQTQYIPIKQMHLNRRGAWGNFLYRDPLDCTAENEIFAVAEVGQTEFQLCKFSIIDGVTYNRNVAALYVPDTDAGTSLMYDPAAEASITITSNDAPAPEHTIDHDRGLVIFDTPMTGGEILRWSGDFSIWVRFQEDRLPFSIDNKSGGEFVVNGEVRLLEMPPPDPAESSGS